MKKLNLNCVVKVKLTDYGKDIFYHKDDELNSSIVQRGWKPIKPHFPEVDEDGFSKFQIWDFMNIYGKHFNIGMTQDILEDLNFYIDEKDLDKL